MKNRLGSTWALVAIFKTLEHKFYAVALALGVSITQLRVKCLQLTSGKSHITHVCLLGLVPSKFSATSVHAFVIFTVSFLVHSLRMGKQRASVSIPPFNGAGNTHGGLGFVRDSDSYFVFLNT